MPLQNRVDPFGEIHATPERGLFTGNRGVIHDARSRTLLTRRWSTRAWIICVCAFRGRRRDVMGRNTPSGNAGWTELFFLDEVSAFAAGHRPCFYCRRERAKDFMGRFAEAFRLPEPKAPQLDARLHAERLASGGVPTALSVAALAALPDGAVVADGDRAFAKRGDKLLDWSFSGYRQVLPLAATDKATWRLLTPPTTIGVLKAGYLPTWHPSEQLMCIAQSPRT